MTEEFKSSGRVVVPRGWRLRNNCDWVNYFACEMTEAYRSLSSFMTILKFQKTPFLTARQALQQIATMAQMLTTYAG